MSSMAYPLGVDPNQQRIPALTPQPGVAAVPAPDATASPLGEVAAASMPLPAAPLPNPPAAPVSALPQSKQLALNPQLPQHPMNMPDPGQLDATYNAEQAQLAHEISTRYNDVLKQLGYLDPATGQFVMGRVETDANRQRSELGRSLGLAGEAETRQRQLEGTLFSGRRGTEQARAEHPFVQGLADLDINVPTQLSDLYDQGAGLMTDYANRQNLLLADAARRRAASLLTSAYPDPGTGGAPADPGADPTAALPDPTLLDTSTPLADPSAAPYQDPIIWQNRGGPLQAV